MCLKYEPASEKSVSLNYEPACRIKLGEEHGRVVVREITPGGVAALNGVLAESDQVPPLPVCLGEAMWRASTLKVNRVVPQIQHVNLGMEHGRVVVRSIIPGGVAALNGVLAESDQVVPRSQSWVTRFGAPGRLS